jgi:hypothetical protein
MITHGFRAYNRRDEKNDELLPTGTLPWCVRARREIVQDDHIGRWEAVCLFECIFAWTISGHCDDGVYVECESRECHVIIPHITQYINEALWRSG